MRFISTIFAIIVLLVGELRGLSQGFANLNFEAANVSGYSPGSTSAPITNAFPGWSAYFLSPSVGTQQLSQVWYDGISLGGAAVSINDSNSSIAPIQGQFSAVLFGGSFQTSAQISQTGLVPDGTVSLLVDANFSGAAFITMLGGETINMIALQAFSGYTLYGGDISSFAGQVSTLSFLEPPSTGSQPSALLLDNIQFSSSPVPEPSEFALGTIGALLLGFRRWRNSSR